MHPRDVVSEAEQPRRVEADRHQQDRQLIGGERRRDERHTDRQGNPPVESGERVVGVLVARSPDGLLRRAAAPAAVLIRSASLARPFATSSPDGSGRASSRPVAQRGLHVVYPDAHPRARGAARRSGAIRRRRGHRARARRSGRSPRPSPGVPATPRCPGRSRSRRYRLRCGSRRRRRRPSWRARPRAARRRGRAAASRFARCSRGSGPRWSCSRRERPTGSPARRAAAPPGAQLVELLRRRLPGSRAASPLDVPVVRRCDEARRFRPAAPSRG